MSAAEFTVFYAWQSDTDKGTNRNFIESTLQAALKNIEKSGAIESSPRLDKDTKDVPGIPEIASTILEKIRQSDCLLCDVSFVGKTLAHCEDKQKPLPNANVMIELGYALSELGWDRIVMVLNTATGKPEELPFDLRNRRWPISYKLTASDNAGRKTEEKSNLAKQLQSAITHIAKLPQRQKRGTTSQRLAALEEIVTKQSANINQTTTLGRLVASLQRTTEKQAAPVPNAGAKCIQIRDSLIKKVLGNDFYDVISTRGTFVLAICPSSVPSHLPLFDQKKDMLTQELKPVYSSGWDSRIYGDRLLTHSTRDGKTEAATEITTGISRTFLDEQAPADTLFIPIVVYEKSTTDAVFHYLKALKALGATGPWFVSLGIVAMKKSQLLVGQRFAFTGRLFVGEEILPPVIEIGPDVEVDDPQAVARALRPAFDYVWREHNYPQSLDYGETGDWIGH